MIILKDLQQGTEEWLKEKLGKPSASNCSRIVTMDGKPSKQREGYLYELAAERVTGMAAPGYKNGAIEEGHDREDEARKYFEFEHDVTVEQVGVIYPDEEKKYLCSPDGIVGNKEGVELKNPLPKTQAKYLYNGGLPSEYFGQVQFSLLVTGFKVWHFLSYVPLMRPVYVKVERDKEFLAALKLELERFCDDLNQITERIK